MRPSIFELSLLILALWGSQSVLLASDIPQVSPYALYLEAKLAETRQQHRQSLDFWEALSLQATLPYPRRKSIAEHLVQSHGHRVARQWLSSQETGSVQDLALRHEFNFYHVPRKDLNLQAWSLEVLHSIRKHPDSLELQTVLQNYAVDATAMPAEIPDALSEDLAIRYFRSLQNRMQLGNLETREANLPHLHAVLKELEQKSSLGKNPASKWFYFIIDFHIATADLEKAYAQLSQQLQSWPKDLGLLKRLYLLQVADHELQDAKLTFATLLTAGELDLETYSSHAQTLFENRDPNGALLVLWQGLRVHPAPAKVYAQALKFSLQSDLDLEKRLQFAQRAHALFPNHAEVAYALGTYHFLNDDPANTIAAFERTATLAQPREPALLDVRMYHALGHSHAALGQMESALKAFDTALQQSPQPQAELYGECGLSAAQLCLQQNPIHPDVGRYCQKALRGLPEEVAVHRLWAEWHFNRGKYQESLKALENARLYLNPAHSEASACLRLRAKNLVALGQSDQAKQALVEGLASFELPPEERLHLESQLKGIP